MVWTTSSTSCQHHGRHHYQHHFNIIVNIIMDGIHPQTSTFHPLYIHNVIKSLHKNIHILKHLELVWTVLKYFETFWISVRYFEMFWNVFNKCEIFQILLRYFETSLIVRYFIYLKHLELVWNILKYF